MRARLIKDEQGLWILFNDGQMKQADREDLRNFLCFFKLIRCLNARALGDDETKRARVANAYRADRAYVYVR